MAHAGQVGPRPWLRQEQDTCPVDPRQQAWIESKMRWLRNEFGAQAARGELARPGPRFYPADYQGTDEQILGLVARVEQIMGVEPGRVTPRLFDGEQERAADAKKLTTRSAKHTVGRYRLRDGREYIEIDSTKADDPLVLTAIIAHELAHARLIGEDRDARSEDHEKLTDLTALYLGMGVFMANASISFKQTAHGFSVEPLGDLSERVLLGQGDFQYHQLGYIEEADYGYALGCLCGIRGETDPEWAGALDPGIRVLLRRTLNYFRAAAESAGHG